MLVILLYVAFVAAPALVSATNGLGAMLQSTGILAGAGNMLAGLTVRDFDLAAHAVLALTIGYSAFISEIFRAGIQSIGPRTDGSGAFLRYELLASDAACRAAAGDPQRVAAAGQRLHRNAQPSLVSVLGVQDITRARQSLSGRAPFACSKPTTWSHSCT